MEQELNDELLLDATSELDEESIIELNDEDFFDLEEPDEDEFEEDNFEDDNLDDDEADEVDPEAEARREEERQIAEIPDLPVPGSMTKDELIAEAYRMRKLVVAQDAREKGMIIELDYLRNELKCARRQIVEMKYHLEEVQQEYGREREVASNCAGILRDFLFKWLTPNNRKYVKRVFRFYDDYDQTRVIYAVLKYLLFGEKTGFHREVLKWHFKLICDKIDEDAIVLPSHSLMVKIMQKYGLFEELKNISIEKLKDYGNSESNGSEEEQTPGEGGC